MIKRRTIIIISWIAILIWACNRPESQDTNKPQHLVDSFDSAVPHGTALPKTELSESEKLQLQYATGKEAILVNVDSFMRIMQQNDNDLILYNFIAIDSEKCKQTTFDLLKLQSEIIGPEKFKIRHVIPSTGSGELINGLIREWGLVDPVYQVGLDTMNYGYSLIDNNWNGYFPALLLINQEEELRLFYQKSFSIEELEALLLPLTF